MNYVAAMLLLGMDLDEEKAFWAMVALIDDNGGPHQKLLLVLHTLTHAQLGCCFWEHADHLSTHSCCQCNAHPSFLPSMACQ